MNYNVFREGKNIGSFTAEQLKNALASGILAPSDTFFAEGMAGLTPLSQWQSPAETTGSPAAPLAPVPALPVAGQPVGTIDWDRLPAGPVPEACLRCHSLEVKSVELVHKMGSSHGSAVGATMFGGLGAASTQSSTDLAEELAPPEKITGALWIFVIGSVLAIYCLYTQRTSTAFWLIGLGSIAASIAFMVYASRRYAKERYLWRNQWVCMKCGHKFHSLAPGASVDG